MPADEPAAKVGQPISRDSTSRMPIGGATRKPDTKVSFPNVDTIPYELNRPISRDSTSKVLTGGATRELDTKVDQPISRDSSPKVLTGRATREPDTKVDQPISRDSTSKVLAGGATRELDTKVDQPISRDSSPKAAKLKTRSDKERHSLLTKIFTHIGAGVNTDLNRDPEDSAEVVLSGHLTCEEKKRLNGGLGGLYYSPAGKIYRIT
ncbi:hypothetical protein PSTT_01925 [Puccinia striiformis]|uniref:Uncharacterized protein n=1 Tax=Puccinia striiformis TaxID=27350 RepID=A0A2S4W1L7_9BASI|nr:hypothetical protein PSTT_01925 [Puccinia striiformis]